MREKEKRKKGEEPFFGEEGKREREFTRPSASQHLLWTKWDDDDDDANRPCNNRQNDK